MENYKKGNLVEYFERTKNTVEQELANKKMFINPFSTNVSLTDKPGKCLKNTCRRVSF